MIQTTTLLLAILLVVGCRHSGTPFLNAIDSIEKYKALESKAYWSKKYDSVGYYQIQWADWILKADSINSK